MSFLSRIGLIETEEQERARLAQAPEGSINHYLSTLPVTIEEWPKDLLVELPWEPPRTDRPYRVVVVPIEFRKDALPEGVEEEPLPRKLHSGSWTCAVVFSDHPSYPVGGYRIVVSAAEIARGRKVDLAGYRAPLSSESSRPESPGKQPPSESRGHPFAAGGAPKTAAGRKISEAPS
ncbi:hypothetical protein ACOT81_38670 [Streptomyces sp. WI04-05B]|uniref:Uncharacterized protein n=1 Tax=Streptomyces turgidiscabies (strain Car8) TaxID=698760 RepID=L7F4P0_STRT8|nr:MULTISPECIES: hypothetical protein [Streptomyces]ELP66282.1 hypothetical protein STRTUCAR8_01579 [Streptomyces turgidiscabies Car8]MDX2547524.1 hypothetical protein [Streptomyces sp. WI04-05B]MDX2589917.1 hypothetical protein [Streptomyces sp. WI04-05A]MDX3499790.1 hypothetical protein [Streptomyces turgidiscabies]